MKKLLLITVLLISFTFTSCGLFDFEELNASSYNGDDTANEIVDCIKRKDATSFSSLFSKKLQQKADFSSECQAFLDYINGTVISNNSVHEGGSTEDKIRENGKTTIYTALKFSIYTTSGEYHIAFRFCSLDQKDHDNEGILSIYVIKAENYQIDAKYGGNGFWTPGINIIDYVVTEPHQQGPK